MSVFGINLLLLGVWAVVFRGHLDSRKNGSPLFIAIVSIQLSLVALFSPLVSDAQVYASYAQSHSYGSLEIGWRFFSELVWMIWPSGKGLLWVSNAFLLISFARFCWRRSANLAMSYLLFICLGIWGMSFYILRQSLALAVLLFAYGFIERRQPFPFAVLVLLAALFHRTALIFLFLYPLSLVRRDSFYHFAALAIGAILMLCGSEFAIFIAQFARSDYSATQLSGESLLLLMVGLLVFTELCLNRSKEEGVLGHALEFSCVLQVVALHLSVFTRVTRYFSISLAILIPNSLKEIRDRKLSFLCSAVISVCMVLFYSIVQNSAFPGGAEAYIPTIPNVLPFGIML